MRNPIRKVGDVTPDGLLITPVQPGPQAPAGATHKIEWIPPYLHECGPPGGFWTMVALNQEWTPPGWPVMEGTALTHHRVLADWAAGELGRPVRLHAAFEVATRTVYRNILGAYWGIPARPFRREPVFYVVPQP
jgi:hypothetical protein